MSFASKLEQQPAPTGQADAQATKETAPAPAMKVVHEQQKEPAVQHEEDLGVKEQLESLYSDIEYMNGLFPSLNIRTLADYAKELEKASMENLKKAAEKGEVEDHGLIPGNVFAALSSLDQQSADEADLGIVEVDDSGLIKLYNDYEAQLAGVQKDSVFGKNFFTQIAPCTNNRLFLGAFKQGVQNNAIDKKFNYTFTYKMKPTPVVIQIYREPQSKRNFIFVKKR